MTTLSVKVLNDSCVVGGNTSKAPTDVLLFCVAGVGPPPPSPSFCKAAICRDNICYCTPGAEHTSLTASKEIVRGRRVL